MLKSTLLILIALPLAAPLTSRASTLYRCADEFGHVTYTNYKPAIRKCTVLSRDDAPKAASRTAGSASTKPSPADFPKVASQTQKSRDGDRRYILEQELSAELKNLDEARKSLAAQLGAPSAEPARAQPIRDRIALHERNLDALRREIANLK